MVQSEIYNRVFRICFGNGAGTAFTMEHQGEQFLVTAKHLFKNAGFPSSASIRLVIGKDYQSYEVDIRYPANPNVDIAVMKLKTKSFLTPVYQNSYSTEGLVYGQDVYFVGFPYEYDTILGLIPGGNAPIPFVKKACVSAILQNGMGTILLDGINNPGFSGSPVCFKKIGSTEKTMSILGVISSYRFDKQPIYDQNGTQTSFYVKENTGIIVVTDIKYAIQIAEEWISQTH